MSAPVMLITGASRGIGAATARAARDAGYQLALLSRSPDSLAALAEELSANALPVPCDVTDWSSVSKAVEEVENRFGGVDVAFANAGANRRTSFLGGEGAAPDEWKDVVLTNVYGAAITARATLPLLLRTRGHLVLTGSVAGRGIRPGNLYSATKWAVTALAQNIRAECADTGVRVTLVQPGMVETDMLTDEQRQRPMLHPDDIARAVLYAVGQPTTVDVNEIAVRPTGQDPMR